MISYHRPYKNDLISCKNQKVTLMFSQIPNNHQPTDFINVAELIPSLRIDIRYATCNNFLGEAVEGYSANKALLTQAAAKALAHAQQQALAQGYCFVIFDAFRPTRAIQHFHRWADQADNPILKQRFYPHLSKKALFAKGYIAKQSSHSRGSTIDLSLCKHTTGELLDMGTEFDFFGAASWLDYPNLTD
ncbi:MAG TPA: peptidase M15, partial [Thiothrix sp.]|nr:peptidase M15 [Thiothrix sp.]